MPQLVMRRPHLRDVPAVAPPPAGYRLRPFADPADVAALAATLATAFDEPWMRRACGGSWRTRPT